MYFSERLHVLMETRNTTAYKISKAIGCSNSSVANWRAGTVEPDSGNIRKLADFFGVSMSFFLDEEPYLSSSERLSYLMLVDGLSKEKIATATGVDVETVDKWLCEGMNFDQYVPALCRLMEVTADYFVFNGVPPHAAPSNLKYEEAWLINDVRDLMKNGSTWDDILLALSLSPKAVRIAERWSNLDEDGRFVVGGALVAEERRIVAGKKGDSA